MLKQSVLILSLMLCAGELQAQYADDQPKSLRGLKSVAVNFREPTAKMDPALREDMFDAAALELRKAGVKVVRESGSSADAVLNLTVAIQTGIADYVNVRMDVEQDVRVVRTADTLRLVTWYYEDAKQEGSWRNTAKPMVMKAVNKLLSDWLDANGR